MINLSKLHLVPKDISLDHAFCMTDFTSTVNHVVIVLVIFSKKLYTLPLQRNIQHP